MSVTNALANTTTGLLNTVNISLNQVNKVAQAVDLSTDLLLSNADIWAQRGIERNKALKAQITQEAKHSAAIKIAERSAAHRQWISQDKLRAADFEAALKYVESFYN